MDMTPQTWPNWYDGRHINEVLFCQQFLEKHPMKCVRGRLFTVDGLIAVSYTHLDVYKRQMYPNPYRTRGLPRTLSAIPKDFLTGLQGRKTPKMIPR